MKFKIKLEFAHEAGDVPDKFVFIGNFDFSIKPDTGALDIFLYGNVIGDDFINWYAKHRPCVMAHLTFIDGGVPLVCMGGVCEILHVHRLINGLWHVRLFKI